MKNSIFITLLILFSFAFGLDLDRGKLSDQPVWVQKTVADINKQLDRYAMPGGVVGLAIKDIESGDYFSMNGWRIFNPASVIKIPVMIEAYHQIEQGRLALGTKLTLEQHHKLPGSGSLQFFRNKSILSVGRLIELMITDSDNTATAMLIEKLGMYRINATMKKIGMKKTILRDWTMLNKLPGHHNVTSPEDMLRVMEKMYEGRLISKAASEAMLATMKRQHHKWGIARFLPPDVVVANKTGSLDFVRNDVGIIWQNNKPYIVSIFAEHLPSNHGGSVMVGALSRAIFENRSVL
jgi:beta-lactamase class A